MFSESWHHVARERIALRPSIRIRKQVFRGETWYVLQDPFSNRFVRFRPEVYRFVSRLSRHRTVEEVWQACVDDDPDSAPGQQEVIHLLAQLYQASLIQSDVSADAGQLFERQRKIRQREFRSKFTSILFIRIPLWDPEPFLKRSWPFVAPFFTRFFGLVWLVVVGLGLKTAVDHWPALSDGSQQVLAPGNLPLLYLTFVVIKLLHEFGHAYAVKKFGGEVHSMGVMLLVFSPIPFVDATAAWAFRERWKRVFVGAAGMIVEIFFAAIAAFVWAGTGEGPVHSLAYNAMFVASVTTILFNINPLLRFDGYYILSDLTDSPNLHQRAARQLAFLSERHLFGIEDAVSPARSRTDGIWLALFGVASWIYRLFVFTAIMLFVADRYFGIGLIAAILGFFGLFVLPLIKFVRYLASSPRLAERRPRAVAVTAGGVAAVLVVLGVVPFPDRFRAPGVVLAADRSSITADVSGEVVEIELPSVSEAEPDAVLLRLASPDVEAAVEVAEARLEQVDALESLALDRSVETLLPARLQRAAAEKSLAKAEHDRGSLAIRARRHGVWVSPQLEEFRGVWVRRGTVVGEVIDPAAFEFATVVSQQDAGPFFAELVRSAEVRFPGEAGRRVHARSFRIVPSQQETLPYAGLGWRSGGPVEVVEEDGSGIRVAEPYFLVILDLGSPASDGPAVVHKRTGVARFDLPPKPLLVQWSRSLRQLLQERFRI